MILFNLMPAAVNHIQLVKLVNDDLAAFGSGASTCRFQLPWQRAGIRMTKPSGVSLFHVPLWPISCMNALKTCIFETSSDGVGVRG